VVLLCLDPVGEAGLGCSRSETFWRFYLNRYSACVWECLPYLVPSRASKTLFAGRVAAQARMMHVEHVNKAQGLHVVKLISKI
jgi:hypothetical protein